jgi:hypothetical protein
MTSAQANQPAYKLGFTKALLRTWQEVCARNPDDFVSEVYNRMGDVSRSAPQWLIPFTGPTCFSELLGAEKRVLSVWRGPEAKVVLLIKDNQGKILRKINPSRSEL